MSQFDRQALIKAIREAVETMPVIDANSTSNVGRYWDDDTDGYSKIESTKTFLSGTWLGGNWMDVFLERAATAAADAVLTLEKGDSK